MPAYTIDTLSDWDNWDEDESVTAWLGFHPPPRRVSETRAESHGFAESHNCVTPKELRL